MIYPLSFAVENFDRKKIYPYITKQKLSELQNKENAMQILASKLLANFCQLSLASPVLYLFSTKSAIFFLAVSFDINFALSFHCTNFLHYFILSSFKISL